MKTYSPSSYLQLIFLFLLILDIYLHICTLYIVYVDVPILIYPQN